MGGILTSEAFITGGYDLPARHVIHTLGPVWREERVDEHARWSAELAACYTNSLAIAEEHKLASIAFPSIGTGAFGWDKEKAAKIAIRAILDHDARHIEEVFLCCHNDAVEMFMMGSFARAELHKQAQMRNN